MKTAPALDDFLGQRSRLLRLAYRHLGSTAEAEDVVQEAWLRYSRVDDVSEPAKLLSRIVTRLCIDRATSAQKRREVYVGPWLPEPATGDAWDDAGDRALDISFAVMRTLEQLSPAERAAYFLHELWELDYDEVADTLARSPQTCRKLVSRARERLTEAKARFHPGPQEIARLIDVFQTSVETGDPTLLKALLADDAQLVGDGGGKVQAALNVIRGSDAVSRFMVGVATKTRDQQVGWRLIVVNDHPGLVVTLDGKVDQIFTFDMDAAGKATTIYIVRNPEKLTGLQVE